MTFLPLVLRKLTSLENLNLNFSNMGSFQSKFLNQVFLVLKDQTKPFKNLALNFKECAIDFPNPDPISQGLSLIDFSKLQSFKLHFPLNPPSKILEKLTATLQASPLQRLDLDFSKEKSRYLVPPQFSLNLQSFQSLSYLTLNPDDLKNGIPGVGAAIKPLVQLQSLNICFSEQIETRYDSFNQLLKDIDHELIDFSAGLKDLQNLKRFSLNLKKTWIFGQNKP